MAQRLTLKKIEREITGDVGAVEKHSRSVSA